MIEITNIHGTTFSSASNVHDIYKETEDKNIFEEVVDALILERYSESDDLKNHIKSLPTENKRIAILSLISSDNALWSKINDLLKNRKGGYQRLKEVYLLLRDYVKIADVERKKHGEILTPFKELAEPMVKLVEKYDLEFWKNPNHKVLDSSAGYGTFLILAAYKFMIGLKDWEPDEEKRFKWIVENCLYYGELQAKSVFSWLVAIDPHDEYKTNTYWGSFLTKDFDEHAKNVWGVEKWDLIIQNPPYQKSVDGNNNDKPVWHFFVDKSFNLLNPDAKMVMVHPSGWRGVKTFKSTKDKILSRNILFLKMHSFRQGQEMFNAAINFDFYYLENKKYNGMTHIICEDNSSINMDISSIEVIPSENIEEIISLFAKVGEEKINILSNSSYHHTREYISSIRDKDHIYPCVYTVRSNNTPTFKWSSINNKGHFGIPKVIFSNGASGVLSDTLGEYGMTQFSYGIIDDIENLENIKKALESEYFIKKIMLFKNSLGDKYNRKLLSNLRKDFWKNIPTSKIKITLDNKEELEFYGNISYDVLDYDNNFICYKIEISKKYNDLLSSKGIKVCNHYKSDCPVVFDGSLSESEIQKIRDKYVVYYLHRRNKITIQQRENFYFCLREIVSNPSDINAKEFAQEDINDQLIIKELKIFDNNNLIRTEVYKEGNIISNDDIELLRAEIRDLKLRNIGI